MPTYEYECTSCGHGFETFQSMSEQPLKDCPECGREVRRVIFGGTGVIFKGSGFYVTDKGKSSKTETKSGNTKTKPDTGSGSAAASSAASPCSECPNKGASASCPA
ncbi:MAG: hypothetical protein FWC22_05405 [Treponema sp.]|nr:hypothetical protein [Treponema sp.]